MKKILLGVILGIGGVGLITYITAASGIVDIGADKPHGSLVTGLLTLARESAMARYSKDVVVPDDLASTERQTRGAGNYDAMCADCHLRPDHDKSEIRDGLYPQPPNMVDNDEGDKPGESAKRFWVIKHGIKASGMPAWSKGGMNDQDMWDLVAFLQRLPNLSVEQYRMLVAASEGHSHAGMDDHILDGTRDEMAHGHNGTPFVPSSHATHTHAPRTSPHDDH
jgi:mono/diheme cytochrome c family protein